MTGSSGAALGRRWVGRWRLLGMLLWAGTAQADFEHAYLEANEAFTRSDYDAAAQRFRELLRLMPSDAPYFPHTLLGLALSQERRYQLGVDRKAPHAELACEAAEWYRQYLATPESQTPALEGPTREARGAGRKMDALCAMISRPAPAEPSPGVAKTALAPEAAVGPPDAPPEDLAVAGPHTAPEARPDAAPETSPEGRPEAPPDAALEASPQAPSDDSSDTPLADSSGDSFEDSAEVTSPRAVGRARSGGINGLAWGFTAGAAAALGTGVALYLSAADRLDERDTWIRRYDMATDPTVAENARARANTAHDDGVSRAYASYALLGGAALLAGGAAWAFWSRATPESASTVTVYPTAEGLGIAGCF